MAYSGPAIAASETPAPIDSDEWHEPGVDPGEWTRRANLRARMFGVASEPARIGRFVLLETLGAGGMGVVHAAFDPRLARRVALKLVHHDVTTKGVEARLLREAQTMARLSHPNVVQIHEVGVWDGRIFIAMEFVAGRTLTAWLAAAARPWQEVIAGFIDAGRGLAAAHAAGIVHRDFKPDNVLVGDDGRIRVTDFGLAHGLRPDGEVKDAWREPGDPLAALTGAAHTATGALAGTPAYMSPEQFLGAPATAASDQFSFCVALHQALHGIHPFAGDDRLELAKSVLAGTRRDPPRLRGPRRIHRALVRGLARDPAARHPTMDALLAALAPRPRWVLAAPALTLAFAGVAALTVLTRSGEDPCDDANVLLAGTWDAERRAALERVFAASAVPDAAVLWTSTAAALDRYGEAVAGVYHHSCQAQQRGESSSELHDLRVACLRRRVAVVAGVVRALTTGDADAVRQAPQAATGLDDLGACDDDRTVLQGTAPPPAGQAAALTQIQADLADARALELLGDLAASTTRSDATLAAARTLNHAPTLAEALYQRGRLAVLARDTAIADSTLREASSLAVGSRHDSLVPDLWLWRVKHACVSTEGSLASAKDLLQQAEAWQQRSVDTPQRSSDLALARSLVAERAGDHAAGALESQRVIDLRTEIYGADQLPVAIARLTHANHLAGAGRTREAIAEYRVTLDTFTRRVGEAHSLVADAHFNLAAALLDEPDDAAQTEAVTHLQASDAIYTALSGPVPRIELADGHVALARVAHVRGDLDEAERQAVAATAVYEHYPTHPDRAIGLSLRAVLAHDRGRYDEALDLHTRARALLVEAHGEASDLVTDIDLNIAGVLLARGDADAARQRYEAAISALARAQGDDSINLRDPLQGLARAQLAAGRACAARDTLTREASLPRAPDDPPATEYLELVRTAASACSSNK